MSATVPTDSPAPPPRRRGRPAGDRVQDTIQSLVKGLAIIEFLSQANSAVGVTEVAKAVGLPKATAHRLLATLHASNAVVYEAEAQRYTLGQSIIRYGLMGVRRLSLTRLAQPHLDRLQRETGETSVLAVRHGNYKVFIEQVESSQQIRHSVPLGERLPLYHGGGGLAILAMMKAEEIDTYLASETLKKLSSSTITDKSRLREELELTRKRGYTISRSDRAVAIGAPIVDHSGIVQGALVLHAPSFRMTNDQAVKAALLAKREADEVSASLGYTEFD